MDALEALLTLGVGGLITYCLVKGEPVPTEAQILKQLESAKPRLIEPLNIDTTEARDNVKYPLAGKSIYVVNPTTPSNPVYIRLNEADAPLIELTSQRVIKVPFYCIYITNDAGTGTLSIVANKTETLELKEAVADVNIAAQTVGTVSVDIIAQSIGNIAVDIAAQSVGNLEIDIVAQSVGHITIDIAAQSLGNLNVNLAAQTADIDINIAAQVANVDINIAAQSGNIDVNLADSGIMLGIDIQAQYITVEVDITKVGGTALTGANWTTYFSRINVNLSTIASEATLAAQLDVVLSTRASEATLAAQLDVVLSTRASEATLASILSQLDVALSTVASDAELAKKVNKATTPVIYNVSVGSADTEYSQALPANTKRFSICLRDGTAFRLAFETGKVATPTEPYKTVLANTPYTDELVEPSSLTLYFACGTGSKNAEIIAWS